ncbi:hypothetical protein AAG602_06995 [Citromicrobium bathyomarinum]
MMRGIAMAMGALLIVAMPAGPVGAQNDGPVIRNYQMEGDLESPNDIGCVPIDQARPAYNPVDLYRGAAACIAREEWDDAASLFALGGVYGRYDMRRVSDRTAHQAVMVAQMSAFGDLEEAQQAKLSETVGRIADDPEELGALCSAIAALGPPTYQPRYMSRHGLGAFTGNEGSAPEGFDPQATFKEVMTSFLHCPAAE